MSNFEEKISEEYKKASMKGFGNESGVKAMDYLIEGLKKENLLIDTSVELPDFVAKGLEAIIGNFEKIFYIYDFTDKKTDDWLESEENKRKFFIAYLFKNYTVEEEKRLLYLPELGFMKIGKNGKLESVGNRLEEATLFTDEMIKSIDSRYFNFLVDEDMPIQTPIQEEKLPF